MPNIWITLLTTLLPLLLQWLQTLLGGGKKLTTTQASKLNKISWYCHQISATCDKAGCVVGGTPPTASAEPQEFQDL